MTFFKNIYFGQQFNPTWLGLFVNPIFFARKGLYENISGYSGLLKGRLLDVGCGTKPYKNLFDVNEYIGLEYNSSLARERGVAEYYYNGHAFPFEDESFDSILCNQVLEHVFNPDEFLSEITRVLKPSGKLLLTVPFVWDEHEQPYDYARYSTFGLKHLLERSGLSIIEHKRLGTDVSVIFQLVNAYLYKISENWDKYLRYFFTITVMALVNLLGLISKWIMPRNADLFLDHIVLGEKSK